MLVSMAFCSQATYMQCVLAFLSYSDAHSLSLLQVNHLRCLHEFVEAQAAYYAQCHKHMQELQKELSRCVEFLVAW